MNVAHRKQMFVLSLSLFVSFSQSHCTVEVLPGKLLWKRMQTLAAGQRVTLDAMLAVVIGRLTR